MLYRGDDTDAFGRKFLTINVKDADKYNISKAVFTCGLIRKEFVNPIFPLDVELSAEETEKLNYKNYGYLALYDEYDRKITLKGYVTFSTKSKVV